MAKLVIVAPFFAGCVAKSPPHPAVCLGVCDGVVLRGQSCVQGLMLGSEQEISHSRRYGSLLSKILDLMVRSQMQQVAGGGKVATPIQNTLSAGPTHTSVEGF